MIEAKRSSISETKGPDTFALPTKSDFNEVQKQVMRILCTFYVKIRVNLSHYTLISARNKYLGNLRGNWMLCSQIFNIIVFVRFDGMTIFWIICYTQVPSGKPIKAAWMELFDQGGASEEQARGRRSHADIRCVSLPIAVQN